MKSMFLFGACIFLLLALLPSTYAYYVYSDLVTDGALSYHIPGKGTYGATGNITDVYGVRNCTITGTVLTGTYPDRGFTGINFTGSADYCEIADANVLGFSGGAGTVAFIAHVQADQLMHYVSQYATTGNQRGWYIQFQNSAPDNSIVFTLGYNSGASFLQASSAANAAVVGTTQCIVVTYNQSVANGTMRIYVNGTEVSYTTPNNLSGGAANSNQNIRWGGYQAATGRDFIDIMGYLTQSTKQWNSSQIQNFCNVALAGGDIFETAPDDTCTYGGSGDWYIQDNCTITGDVDMGGNDVFLNKSGISVNFSARLYNYGIIGAIYSASHPVLWFPKGVGVLG